MRPLGLPTTHSSHWWPSAIWTGITIWCPGIVRLLSKRAISECADDYLRLLTEKIIPTAEREIAGVPRWRGIAGYSLAGLFALYAIYQTDLFSRVGSMSGSLWFPSMKEYIFSHEPKRLPDYMYFSLEIKRARPGTRSCEASARTRKRSSPSSRTKGSTQCFS